MHHHARQLPHPMVIQNAKYYHAFHYTEAEYVALSTALRDVICILHLTKELTANSIHVPLPDVPQVTCRVFKDNAGAVELANNPKLHPRTKHIAIPYHHFRQHVKEGTIKVQPISTKLQIVDIFTKPLPKEAFQFLRSLLQGW